MPNRRVIMNLCMSMDGYIEGSNGEIDWCPTDQDYGMTAFWESIDTILFGRKSYELSLKMGIEAFAGKEHVVYSRSKQFENATMISENWLEETKKLIAQAGKDLWLFGGAQLITDFLEAGLIDEMQIAMVPVILGGGIPLFKDLKKAHQLKLKQTKEYSSGVLQLFYDCNA